MKIPQTEVPRKQQAVGIDEQEVSTVQTSSGTAADETDEFEYVLSTDSNSSGHATSFSLGLTVPFGTPPPASQEQPPTEDDAATETETEPGDDTAVSGDAATASTAADDDKDGL